ncbi:MAG: TraB/GumN family protein, partial [Bacteroidetes bacterium]|nr:TraB/GumN family protein [Bacteroidota bacterium]
MQKLSTLICLLALIQVSSHAQNPAARKTARATAGNPPLEHTLLWEITGPELSHPSYLFGTMHLLCADDAKLSDSLRYSIEDAKQVYFEIDMDNLMETMSALKYLNMNNDTKLSDLLSPDEYQRVKAYLGKQKMMLPASMVDRI